MTPEEIVEAKALCERAGDVLDGDIAFRRLRTLLPKALAALEASDKMVAQAADLLGKCVGGPRPDCDFCKWDDALAAWRKSRGEGGEK